MRAVVRQYQDAVNNRDRKAIAPLSTSDAYFRGRTGFVTSGKAAIQEQLHKDSPSNSAKDARHIHVISIRFLGSDVAIVDSVMERFGVRTADAKPTEGRRASILTLSLAKEAAGWSRRPTAYGPRLVLTWESACSSPASSGGQVPAALHT